MYLTGKPALSKARSIEHNALQAVDGYLGTEFDTAALHGLSGIGRRGGYNDFLRVYWFGRRAQSLIGVTGTRDSIRKILRGDRSASEELTAIHLLRDGHRDTELELSPPTFVGDRTKQPDFRIRKKGDPWVYVEVTQLNRSVASARVTDLLQRLGEGVMDIDRPFILEVVLDREPAESEIDALVYEARLECEREAGTTRELAGLGRLLVKTGDVSVVVPSVESDTVPRMTLARSLLGPVAPNRQAIIRVPFRDERAEDVLANEAKQLPKNECGLVMVNVNLQPTAFEHWSKRIPERFASGNHTRVAGVLLFMHATQASTRGLVWFPHVRFMPNPHARVPIAPWVTAEFERIRADARALASM